MNINVINRIYLGQIGRVPVIEQHEKLSYLNEHISYEVIMLNYTFMRVMTFLHCGRRTRAECILGSLRRPRVELGRVPVKEGAEE